MGENASKWNKAYWVDLGERVGSTFVYALITLLTANSVTAINAELAWVIVGLPTLLSLLKGLGANLRGAEPSASLADVDSYGPDDPGKHELPAAA